MKDCGNRLEFELQGDRMRLKRAYLCRDRLCPVCNWRLGMKRLNEAIEVCKRLSERYPDTKAIHVVLTVRNVSADELGETIKSISEGFTRLRKRQLWRDYVRGFARSIEITRNDETGLYHPHIHVIAIVPGHYKRQIGIGDWGDMWRDCCRLNYNPVVYAAHAYKKRPQIEAPSDAQYATERIIEGLREKGTEERLDALREAIKYAIKPDVFIPMVAAGDTVEIARAVAGVKLISYGGILKELRAELGYSDHEGPDLAPAAEIDLGAISPAYAVVYEWAARAGEYRRVN